MAKNRLTGLDQHLHLAHGVEKAPATFRTAALMDRLKGMTLDEQILEVKRTMKEPNPGEMLASPELTIWINTHSERIVELAKEGRLNDEQ